MRKTTWGWLAAGVAAAAAIAAVVYEERKPKSSTTTSSPGAVVFKPSVPGGTWALQQQGTLHLQPIKLQPVPPKAAVTLDLTSSPMSTSAIAGQAIGIAVPARFDLTQIVALSQPSPIGSSPTIPAGVDTGQGGTVLLTLTGYAGDVIFSGVNPDGNAFSSLLHLVGFGKP